MIENNPYSTPQSEVIINPISTEKFQGLDFRQLKKLYHRSCNVNVINCLLILGCMLFTFVSILPNLTYESFRRGVFAAAALFCAVTAVGLVQRTGWGRILGIIACIVSLINFPIGTVVGGFGLFAFFGAPELFGINRVTHKELKSEFKMLKGFQTK